MVHFIDARSNFLEREAVVALRLRAARSRDGEGTDGRGDGGNAERTFEQVAPVEARGDDIANGGIVCGIASNILRRFEGLGARLRNRSMALSCLVAGDGGLDAL